MLCIDEALTRISRHPAAYPIVYPQLRRAVVRRFPFAIFYELDSIQVVAIFHSRRNPESFTGKERTSQWRNSITIFAVAPRSAGSFGFGTYPFCAERVGPVNKLSTW